MKKTVPIGIIGLLATLVLVGSSAPAFASPKWRPHHSRHHRSFKARVHDSKVNTRVERRFDLNGNGRIGPRERKAMIKSH